MLLRLSEAIAISLALYTPPAWVCAAQVPDVGSTITLPDAPDPHIPASSPVAVKPPCQAPKTSGGPPATTTDVPAFTLQPGPGTARPPCKASWGSRYGHFLDGPRTKSIDTKDKAWLAARNVADPFNIITILGNAAITIGEDSHSVYGPGMAGFGKYTGVSFSQNMTGEFVGTFLISSIAHQDPRYHSMPHASIPRRVEHGIVQVVWTRSDHGKPMLNYANLLGYAIDDEISNLYVPGRQTNASATAARYATGIAFTPVDNFITEFLPDVASHIHIQVVILQRIINQVARTEGGQE